MSHPPLAMPLKQPLVGQERCENCKFFIAGQGGEGHCRRNPPTAGVIIKGGQPAFISAFTPTKETHWCGEFVLALIKSN